MNLKGKIQKIENGKMTIGIFGTRNYLLVLPANSDKLKLNDNVSVNILNKIAFVSKLERK